MGGQFAPESELSKEFHPRQRWRKVQHLVSLVWRRWLKECLPIVEGKTKVVEIVKDLNVGDVVLVMQQGLSRGNWPLGRIIDVYPGRDRHTCTRVTKVQCGQKTYIWPIHKLIDLMI
jgi:hypothetical protein